MSEPTPCQLSGRPGINRLKRSLVKSNLVYQAVGLGLVSPVIAGWSWMFSRQYCTSDCQIPSSCMPHTNSDTMTCMSGGGIQGLGSDHWSVCKSRFYTLGTYGWSWRPSWSTASGSRSTYRLFHSSKLAGLFFISYNFFRSLKACKR